MTIKTVSQAGVVKGVALCSEPPTQDELRTHYSGRFTWVQLKAIVNSGDLGLLKRDKKLQRRYEEWATEVEREYGSTTNYLLHHQLQWGKPDTLLLDDGSTAAVANGESEHCPTLPEYFKGDIPFDSNLICIKRNRWPYSVPSEIEHSLIWTRLPIFHPTLIPPAINTHIQQYGLFGFTGSDDTAESLPSLESCLPALAEWDVTMEDLVRLPVWTEVDETMVRNAGKEVHAFVKRRWDEVNWETAWFVNPPVRLAFHVLCRSAEDD